VTVRVLDQGGAVVRTLLAGAPKNAGTTKVVWDRKTSAGRRAPSGTYRAVVDATDGSSTTSANTSFTVS